MSFMEIERQEPIVYPCLHCGAAAGQSCIPSIKNHGEVWAFGYCFWRSRLSALHLCIEMAKELKLPIVHLEDEINSGPKSFYDDLEKVWKDFDDFLLKGCPKLDQNLFISVANFIGNLRKI